MQLADALHGVALIAGPTAQADVRGVHYDSRRVGQGDLFVAMRGGATDGNRFIANALERGASAIITDSREAFDAARSHSPAIPFALLGSELTAGRRALAQISANVVGHPERTLAVSAVTGTNGKTTTAWLLEQLLRSAGRRCVLVGTIETHVGDEVRSSEHTTPESRDLLALFADGVAAGCTEAVMEMSSHALAQERVWGIPVDVAMFTNLTQDHLDFHGSMEAYGAAKARLFQGVGAPPPRVSIINGDDPEGARLIRDVMDHNRDCSPFGLQVDWGSRAKNVQYQAGKTTFDWLWREERLRIESPLTGRVNLYNLLAAMAAASARRLSVDEIAAAVPKLEQVPGRFQTVPNALGLTVVVDYAHTDDALRNLITLARDLVNPAGGRVITMFGCGGDRDRTKRPKMGRAAGEGSDLIVLTSDNPRSEDPATIADEALAGMLATGAKHVVELDRAKAIERAIREARPGDIVLLAGKGHEKGQTFANVTVPFDDVAVAAGILHALAE